MPDSLTLLSQSGMQWNARPGAFKGKSATEFHGGWVNYYDSSKRWSSVDCILKETVSGFEVTNAPFYFKAPKRSTGYAELISNNRFDRFNKSEITAGEFSQTIKCLDVEDVPGQLFDINGDGRLDAVIYPGAYNSTFAGDLVYYVKHGRVPMLKKLIIFHSRPSSDNARKFEIQYSGKTELSPLKLLSGTRIESRDSWESQLSKNKKLYLHSDIDNNGGLYVRAWDESQKRGLGIGKPFIWDSNPDDISRKVGHIETYIEKTGINKYILTKIIPKSFFTNTIFPVYTDATFFPDPGTGGTTTDGRIDGPFNSNWNTIHDAATGQFVDSLAATCLVQSRHDGSLYRIRKGLFYFDTSSIPSSTPISGVTLSLKIQAFVNGDNDGNNFISALQVQGNNIVSDSNLNVADYDLVGDSINNPTEGSNRFSLNSAVVGQFMNLIFDTTGISWVAKNSQQRPSGGTPGITYTGLREGHDQVDNPVALSSQSQMGFFTADRVGTDEDPRLIVVLPKIASYHKIKSSTRIPINAGIR